MKTAFIVSTGTELLLGDTEDTNSLFISRRLALLGIRLVGRETVGDNEEMLGNAFQTAFQKADMVLSSGGMGPTADDMTREIACQTLGLPLVLRHEELEKIKDYFVKRQRKMPDINAKQAMFPQNALILDNARGTACGFIVEHNNKCLIMLPGPPREMEPMFRNGVEPYLQKVLGESEASAVSRTIRVMGPGESQVEEIIQDIMKNPQGCGIALLAKEGEVHVRVTRHDEAREKARETVDNLINAMAELLGLNVYGEEEQTLPGVVVDMLRKTNQTVSFAESCTGGLVGKLITDISGSSEVFWGGTVTYSNEAKSGLIDVKTETLSKYGAVSPETAREMAEGIRAVAGTDFGIGITGIAGPDGGTPEKPVGLVYIGLSTKDSVSVKECRFLGGRDAIRMLSAKSALDWLRRSIR